MNKDRKVASQVVSGTDRLNVDHTQDVNKIILFKQKEVRRQLHGCEWWFVITDVVRALVDTNNPKDYLKKVRSREIENPELAQKRMKMIYKLKGYSDEWIERRVRSQRQKGIRCQ